MSNKIKLWLEGDVASLYETGQTAEEFLTQHFGGVEQAIAKGLKVALNDVEQFFGELEDKVDEFIDPVPPISGPALTPEELAALPEPDSAAKENPAE